MNATVEEVDAVTRKITVTLPSEVVNKELNRAYRNLQREVQMPGFRPGRVPVSILEARFHDQVEGEVRAKLISDTFESVVEENGLFVVSQPSVDPNKVRRNQDFTYVATVEIKPEVDATGYLDLKLTRTRRPVEDSDVAEQLDAAREGKRTLVEVEEDRPLRDGDVARIEYTMETDGKKGDREPRSIHLPVRLDDTTFLPGFAARILGMVKGETRTFDIEIPEDFHQSSLAGKTPRFTVTLQDIKRYEVPDLDEELAKDLEFETLDELKADIRKRLEQAADGEADARLREQIVDALISANPIPLPRGLVHETVNRLAREQRWRRGEHVSASQVSLGEEEEAKLEEVAEKQLRRTLIVESIAKKEQIEVSDEDVDRFLEKIAGETGQRIEALRGQYLKNNAMDELRTNVLEEKVFKFVMDKASISDGGEAPESDGGGDRRATGDSGEVTEAAGGKASDDTPDVPGAAAGE